MQVVFKLLTEMTDNLTPWTRTGGDNSFDVVAMERWMNTVLASRVDHVQVHCLSALAATRPEPWASSGPVAPSCPRSH